MAWSLYESGKVLEPLKFSNGKNQEDVVKEVIQAIKQGSKIIFIRGVCGTGKSVIALNLAKELGKTSIVVPIKNLQKQYEQDYTNKKYLLKENKDRLKIKIIKGRQNFTCPFLQENCIDAGNIISEENSTLDIFDSNTSSNKTKKGFNKDDNSCNNLFLPCKIEIKEKNLAIIKDYLRKHKDIRKNISFKDVRRLAIAGICDYWSPIVPFELDYNLKDAKIESYTGLKNKRFKIYRRKAGCQYYDQYQSYLDSDVLIFNSDKYKIETVMDRKPGTEVEIIDECDEFLDSFANSGIINVQRLNFALGSLFSENEWANKEIQALIKLTREIANDEQKKEMIPLKETKILSILEKFDGLMDYVEADEENYCYHAEEVAKTFSGLYDETYVFFEKTERGMAVKLVTINLGKRFKEMLDKNKVFILMSGTIHSEKVLNDIFGLSQFRVIEAETKTPGKISLLRTGLEINCKYENFKQGRVTREQYLLALEKCITQATRPVLVHVVSFSDLPKENEAKKLNLSIMTQEKLIEQQKNAEDAIRKFKGKETPFLYTTKCNRGMDFPGDICNSIILTKYPYPDISDPFWKLLKKSKPEHYNGFYLDKARREFLQRIYRGLRHENDHIFLLSPDIRVFENARF